MSGYPDFVARLAELGRARRGRPPRVSPARLYPARVEREIAELLEDELDGMGDRLRMAAANGSPGWTSDDASDVARTDDSLPPGFADKVRLLAGKVVDFNTEAFAGLSELSVGERFFATAGDRDRIVDAWTENFMTLCRSANAEMKARVSVVLSGAAMEGRPISETAKAVRNACGTFAASKAELIARTETGKLNTAIARNQMESAGIEYYEWGAAMDGRTRESHALMDGRICKWGDDSHCYEWTDGRDGRRLKRVARPKGAYEGAPGTDFRCRCVAIPYVPEYEKGYERGRAKGEQRGVVQSAEHPSPLERERTERERLREQIERAKAFSELKAFKVKGYNLEKALKSERAENRKALVDVFSSLADSVDIGLVKKLTIPSLKALSSTIPETFAKLGFEKFRRIVPGNDDLILGYNEGSLYVNPVEFNHITANPKEFFKESIIRFGKKNGVRQFAIDTASHVKSHIVNHEIGHFLFEKYVKGGGSTNGLRLVRDEMVKSGEIDAISFYANSPDPEELFAECFAMFARKDPALPKKMLDYVEKVIHDAAIQTS